MNMISCDIFKKRLQDFLEENISGELKHDMEAHISICENCRTLYDGEKTTCDIFEEAFSDKDIKYESQREIILKRIDRNKYGKKLKSKLLTSIRRFTAVYVLVAVLIIACILSYPSLTNMFIPGKTIPGNSNPANNNISNPVDTQTKTQIKITEEELPLPQDAKDSTAARILDNAKGMDAGFDRWTICYSKGGRTIFFNTPGLLAYSSQGGKGNYYGAIDLEKLGFNYMSGEAVTMFEPSPDGNSIIIWNWGVDALVNGNSDVYYYDFTTKNTKTFRRDDKMNIAGAWSKSSSYYVFGDREGKKITVYDIKQDKVSEISMSIGALEQLYVSDSGDVIAVSDKNYLFKNTNNKYNPEGLPITGEIIGFTKSGSIAYFEDGKVCKYDSGSKSLLKDIGNLFKLSNPYIFTGVRDMEHPMFSNGSTVLVYDLDTSFYSFDISDISSKYVRLSEDSKTCFVRSDKDAEVITFDGKKAKIKSSNNSEIPVCSFYTNNSLISIIQKNSSTKLGDFQLLKDNIEY